MIILRRFFNSDGERIMREESDTVEFIECFDITGNPDISLAMGDILYRREYVSCIKAFQTIEITNA